jgi:hypothetical protein
MRVIEPFLIGTFQLARLAAYAKKATGLRRGIVVS